MALQRWYSTGDRDEAFRIELSVKLYRALPLAELAVCPGADHFAPLGPDRAWIFASLIRDYARRNLQTH